MLVQIHKIMKKHFNPIFFMSIFTTLSFLSCKGQQAKNEINMEEKNNRTTLLSTTFPELKAQTLAGQNIVFPKEVMGKPTVICIAFVGAAQTLIDTWAAPILEKYSDNSINYYEIPMINATWGLMSNMIDGGMRNGVPKALHKNVATYYGNLSQYKKDLMMPEKNDCYVFLLDKNGNIQFVGNSAASSEKLAALYVAIDKINGL